MGQNLQYLYNVAGNMIGKTGARNFLAHPVSGNPDRPWDAEKFGSVYAGAVVQTIEQWNPETLGRIAAFGRGYGTLEHPENAGGGRQRTSMYEIRCYTWLDQYQSGKNLLVQIAASAILAAMYDILFRSNAKPQGSSAPEESRGTKSPPSSVRLGVV